MQASTCAAQSLECVANNALVSLYLHDSEAREYNQNREGCYRLSDPNNWNANSSVTVTGLGTLWAVLNMSSTSTTIYCPLTKVTIGEADFLQAIVPADNEGDYTLTGFKAVMNVTDPSGATIATH